MKPFYYRLIGYPIALIALIAMFNLISSGQDTSTLEIMKSTPFFADFKIYYSLCILIIIAGLVEKSELRKLDNNIFIKILICVISLIFGYLAYINDPTPLISESYNWVEYFQIIFFGIIWIGLYVQMLQKSKKNRPSK